MITILLMLVLYAFGEGEDGQLGLAASEAPEGERRSEVVDRQHELTYKASTTCFSPATVALAEAPRIIEAGSRSSFAVDGELTFDSTSLHAASN